MIDYILILLILILIAILFRYRKKIKELESSIRSISVRHGKLLEHYIPWIKVEFKTGKSRLNPVQKRIKENIQKGRVEWKEVRIR